MARTHPCHHCHFIGCHHFPTLYGTCIFTFQKSLPFSLIRLLGYQKHIQHGMLLKYILKFSSCSKYLCSDCILFHSAIFVRLTGRLLPPDWSDWGTGLSQLTQQQLQLWQLSESLARPELIFTALHLIARPIFRPFRYHLQLSTFSCLFSSIFQFISYSFKT